MARMAKAARLLAHIGTFMAMELEYINGAGFNQAQEVVPSGIDEHRHGGNVSGHVAEDVLCASPFEVARAGGVKHKPQGVGPRFNGGLGVLDAGDSADFDLAPHE